MFDLAVLNEAFNGSGNVFDRNFVIYAMLVEEIDDIRLETLERCLGNLLNVLWTAVQPSLLAVFDVESEFGRDYHFFGKCGKGFSTKFFFRKGPINFRRSKEGAAGSNSAPIGQIPLLFTYCCSLPKVS